MLYLGSWTNSPPLEFLLERAMTSYRLPCDDIMVVSINTTIKLYGT